MWREIYSFGGFYEQLSSQRISTSALLFHGFLFSQSCNFWSMIDKLLHNLTLNQFNEMKAI